MDAPIASRRSTGRPKINPKNGYFAHPENLLLAMITDQDSEIRMDAFDKITAYREKAETTVRTFSVPKIRFHSESYTQMINWNEVGTITEPPCIQFITDYDLSSTRFSTQIIEIPGNKINSAIGQKHAVKIVKMSWQ